MSHEDCGALVGYENLQGTCCKCKARADWRIERKNKGLPDGYIQWGTRSIYYCNEHLPREILGDMASWGQTLQEPIR